MGEKSLPFAIPAILGYQIYSLPLGAIFTDKSFYDWFCSDFIQLVCNYDYFEYKNLGYEYQAGCAYWGIPLITYDIYARNDIENILNFIKDSIEQNMYVYTFVDLYHIFKDPGIIRTNYVHDMLVYGYNERELLIACFGKNRNLSTFTVEIEDFLKAYAHSQYFYRNYFNIVICFKRKDNYHENFNIYLDKMKRSLYEYLYSIDSFYQCGLYNILEDHTFHSMKAYDYLKELYDANIFIPRPKRAFGLDTSRYLRDYVRYLGDGSAIYDIRPIHVFYEHKKAMEIRLEHLRNKSGSEAMEKYRSKYEALGRIALEARNALLKYSKRTQPDLIDTIINKIETVELEEKELLPDLITSIEGLARC